MAPSLPVTRWHWHRLTFSYRMTPGTTAMVAWQETDEEGIVHLRNSRGRLWLAPTPQIAQASFEFISWPDATKFALGIEAQLVNGFSKDGEFVLDDLRLETLRPAPFSTPSRFERAILNGDFESANLFGYHNPFDGATLAVMRATDTAHGSGHLRHGLGPEGKGASHYYLPLRDDVTLEYGGLYRLSLQARGKGSVALGMNADGNIFDVPYVESGRVFPLAEKDWRDVRADFVIDQQAIRLFSVILFLGGEVDIDDVQLDRLR